jgi:hypothetical protein
LNRIGRPPKAELPAKAGGKQRTEQRRGAPLGVRVPIGAQSPDDEDRLLEAHRRLDANADLHLVLAGIPPPVPRAGHVGELLSRRKRALLTVEHERDPPRPDLYVLGEVVVRMLAAGDKAARLDGEVGGCRRSPWRTRRLWTSRRSAGSRRRRPRAPAKTTRPGPTRACGSLAPPPSALSLVARCERVRDRKVASQSCCNFAAASVPFALSLSRCHLLSFGL